MKVVKVFNNNVFLIENDNNVEEIVTGSTSTTNRCEGHRIGRR